MSIRDIAREANVSIATISRVMNNKPGVGPEVRARVEEIIRRNGYVPNPLARGLVVASNIVGVLVPDLRDPHFAVTADVIQTELNRNGISTLLGCTGSSMEQKRAYIDNIMSYKAIGLILVGSKYADEDLASLLQENLKTMPVVMTNGSLNRDNIQSVTVEVASGTFDCCSHLIERGRKNIFFLQDENTVSNRKKYSGYCEALVAYDIPLQQDRIGWCECTVEGGYRFAKERVDLLKQGDAIMCCRDEVALGVSRALADMGIRVPDDIAISGFNNLSFSQYVSPSLTTVDNQHAVVGELAVDLLMNMLNGKNLHAALSVRPSLVIRESTGGMPL